MTPALAGHAEEAVEAGTRSSGDVIKTTAPGKETATVTMQKPRPSATRAPGSTLLIIASPAAAPLVQ